MRVKVKLSDIHKVLNVRELPGDMERVFELDAEPVEEEEKIRAIWDYSDLGYV